MKSMKMFGNAGGGVKFANISAGDYSMHLYNAAVLQSRCTQRRAMFQRWQKEKEKQKQEGKNTEGGFHFTPDEQTEPSRGLFVSIPWHVPF